MRTLFMDLVLVFLVALSPSPTMGFETGSESPNIVILLADDLGWTGLRCFGSDFYETQRKDEVQPQDRRC